MARLKPDFWLATCGAALFGLTCAGICLKQPVMGVYGIGYGAALDRFVVLTVMQAAVYLLAVGILLRTSAHNLWLILGCAVLLRVPALVTPPFLSNDIFRYIWDGWVQAAGINPYRYVPADAHLAFLRDQVVYPNINRADYAHTIYPPAAEMLFFVASRAAAVCGVAPVLGMKFFMFGCEAVAVAALVKLLDTARLPRARILIYAWSPLPVWEFGNNGHVDAIAVALVALALLWGCQAHSGRAAAALAAAALTKFLPVVLAPAIWRRWDWTFAVVFVVVVGALYAPYLQVGKGVLGFLGGYGAQEGIDNGTGIFLLAALGALVKLPAYAAKVYLAGLAVALLTLAGWAVGQGARTPVAVCAGAAMLAGTVMLGMSPHFPWYYVWLLVPACVVPCSSLLYLTSFAFLLYLNPTHTRLFWPAVLYVPFMALALRDMFSTRLVSSNRLALAEGRKI